MAVAWARAQEDLILARGIPLDPRAASDASRLGVQNIDGIKVLVVNRIPMPDNPELMEAARRMQIITASSRAVTMGHGIMIRADAWGDRELMVHQLIHVMQCERCGGFERYLQLYLSDRAEATFSAGTFEEEARAGAREFCSSEAVKA